MGEVGHVHRLDHEVGLDQERLRGLLAELVPVGVLRLRGDLLHWLERLLLFIVEALLFGARRANSRSSQA